MLFYIYLVAITCEAMSGALAAGRRRMDLFGVSLIAFITALGGGTVRDILLGNFPIGWTQHPAYVYLTIGAGLFTVLVARFMSRLERFFLILDAMGLIAFTIIGCDVVLRMNQANWQYHTTVVIMAGLITGVSGGILRDILCNRIPLVLKQELYASVSLLVAIIYLIMLEISVHPGMAALIAFVVGMVIRVAAIYRGWSLPIFHYSEDKW